jgi:hypothetical protein
LIANPHDHRWDFPCCYWSPLLACRRHYPGRNVEVDSLVPLHRHRPSPKCRRVGSCIALFEACSAFTHVTACTLAGSPEVTLYTGGFSGFVSSPTAPIATGRSDPVPGVGIEPRRAHSVKKTKSRFLGPPCNPGRSDFPIPVLTLAFLEKPFRDRRSLSARSRTPQPVPVCLPARP